MTTLHPAHAALALRNRFALPSRRAAARSSATDRPVLAVIGNGMAGFRFCAHLEALGGTARYRVVIFGEERVPAYDRIRLGDRLEGGGALDLSLQPAGWYARHGFELRTATRVVAIDRNARILRTDTGGDIAYDRLVLATGSRPRVPPIPGVGGERVFVYRSLADIEAIAQAAEGPSGATRRAVVLGGGVLGLELARGLHRRGCDVAVVEVGSHLLHRQLDLEAAGRLAATLRDLGVELHLDRAAVAIEQAGERLCVRLGGKSDGRLEADFVVLAAGVRPRDELARASGLPCDERGGVRVDRTLRTADPRVFAVGECASYRGARYGLVAPCYEMAETLGARLMGEKRAFRDTRQITKLKLDVLEVTSAGDALFDDPGTRSFVDEDATHYRRIVVRNGRLVGVLSVGPWPELPLAVEAVAQRARFGARSERRFQRGRALFPGRSTESIDAWPDSVPVCTCTGTTCGTIRRAHQDGCLTSAAVTARTGAGGVCGSCLPLIDRYLGGAPTAVPRHRAQLAFGAAACVLVLAALALGPIPLQASVRANGLDALWRNGATRQLTGFALLGVSAPTLLLSARKRWPALRLGAYGRWRIAHAVLGCLALAGAAVHTGLRLGHHLDFALMAVFLGLSATGGLAAGATALERRLPPRHAGAVRRASALVHLILFWPFPVLLALHVLKTLYF